MLLVDVDNDLLDRLEPLAARVGSLKAADVDADLSAQTTNGAVTWRERYLPFGGACSHDALSNSFVERRRSQAPAVML